MCSFHSHDAFSFTRWQHYNAITLWSTVVVVHVLRVLFSMQIIRFHMHQVTFKLVNVDTYSMCTCCSRLAVIKVSRTRVCCGWVTKIWFWAPASMLSVVALLLYISLSSPFHSGCSKYLTFCIIFIYIVRRLYTICIRTDLLFEDFAMY